MTGRKRAAIYCRISRDRTGAEAGVGRQEQDCRAHVDRNGWDLVEVFVDNDISAYSGKPRPEFEQLLDLVQAGGVDVVVAWHPDRLTRHPKELERVIDVLDDVGCAVDTVMAGRWDLSTRAGRFAARVVGASARDESEAKSERLRRMHEQKARDGEYRGSTRHYGYEPDGNGSLAVVEAEAAILQECARRALAGETLHAICVDLNDRGVVTVKGLRWRPQTLRRTLTSWTVCGRREHRGEDVGPAKWPAILDRPTRDRLHRLIHDPDRSRPAPARVSLLAGIARCGKCETATKLLTARRQGGRRIYICPPTTRDGCGGVQVDADGLDELVTAAVWAAVDGPALAEEIERTEREAAETPDPAVEAEEIMADLEALAEDHGHRRITRREWLAARAPLEAALAAATSREDTGGRLSVLRPYAGKRGALAKAWPGLSLDQRRAVVSAVVERVLVGPSKARGDIAGRIEVVWRA